MRIAAQRGACKAKILFAVTRDASRPSARSARDARFSRSKSSVHGSSPSSVFLVRTSATFVAPGNRRRRGRPRGLTAAQQRSRRTCHSLRDRRVAFTRSGQDETGRRRTVSTSRALSAASRVAVRARADDDSRAAQPLRRHAPPGHKTPPQDMDAPDDARTTRSRAKKGHRESSWPLKTHQGRGARVRRRCGRHSRTTSKARSGGERETRRAR